VLTWPFRSVRVRVLEREQQLLQARIRDLEAQATRHQADVAYFRTRYEKLADEVLFRRGEIAAPVHVESPAAKENLGTHVMRVANMVGSASGRKAPTHHASAADLPTT
jgi:hypothetical protein